eukprot:NODE_10939_length_1319_cov_8.964765.p2 GENE.NODE_10939_length_1319_cov_8.964765~~NODE_10939_length_1319_cov_8.964765.p2  ORF type:complete len:141 (-),score=39.76 NODE_10939_length_1319_cov_8.964765:443-865(-)
MRSLTYTNPKSASPHPFSIFVGEDVKTQAGPDLKALIASHKQQAAYIDSLHEELRRMNTPSYRPIAGGPGGAPPNAGVQQPMMMMGGGGGAMPMQGMSAGPGGPMAPAGFAASYAVQGGQFGGSGMAQQRQGVPSNLAGF